MNDQEAEMTDFKRLADRAQEEVEKRGGLQAIEEELDERPEDRGREDGPVGQTPADGDDDAARTDQGE